MVDFRVNDGFGQHPKTVGLSLEAVGLWTLAGAWSMRYLTDGYIPTEAMRSISTRRQPLQDLIDRNLLQPSNGGYQFVDWIQYQRTRDQIEADRERNRKRLAKWREGKRDV